MFFPETEVDDAFTSLQSASRVHESCSTKLSTDEKTRRKRFDWCLNLGELARLVLCYGSLATPSRYPMGKRVQVLHLLLFHCCLRLETNISLACGAM